MNTRESFRVRPYQEADLVDCTTCFYESFFTCPISREDRLFLQEYIQVLLEKCNFTLVAENDSKKVVGFICGKYSPELDKDLANTYATKKHYGVWCKMFFKFYLKMYKLPEAFKTQFDGFFAQLQERDTKSFGKCDLELVALCSMVNYRKGLGTALLKQFLRKAQADKADIVRLFTNTLAFYQFYDKRGLSRSMSTLIFQSTPPARGATRATRSPSPSTQFQSTPPARGATKV